MSDFALRTVFVVPVGNTIPTTGSTENLTLGQFGITKDNARTVATAANIGTASFIQVVQGRPGTGLSTKFSDKIKLSKINQWYKVAAENDFANEIWEVGGFAAKCDETLNLSVTIHSGYADAISPNGITKSIVIQTPCCDCGADPCSEVDNDTIVGLFMAKIQQTIAGQKGDASAIKLDTYLNFDVSGTTGSLKIRITAKSLPKYTNPGDPTAFSYEYDRLWFRPYIVKGTATTSDYWTFDACDLTGTTTLIQRSTFPRGTSEETRQAQLDYYSYQAVYKEFFSHAGYNQFYEDYVTDGTFYDLYVIRYGSQDFNSSADHKVDIDEEVDIYIPQAQSAAIETILTAYLGAPLSESPADFAATTTSSTSSTTTTTTTVVIP